MEEVEIDLSYMSKEELLSLLDNMHEMDMTLSEFVNYTLESLISGE
jgi:hypothetical protein